MGFLSGVLSNIKEHLGQHKNSLDDAINILNTNKHAGKNGFSVAIGKVVEGVGRYNKAVEQSNTSIKNPIRTLYKYVKTEKGTLINGLNAIQVPDDAAHDAVEQAETQVRDKLTECQQAADTFNTAFNLRTQTDMNKSITDLNDKIETKVRHSISNVKHESERLKALAQKEQSDLDATIKLISDALSGLGVEVKNEICKQVRDLVEHLKGRVQLIKLQLEDIDKSLKQYAKELQQWIENADKEVQAAKSEAVGIENKKPGENNQRKLTEVAKALADRSGVLCRYIDDVKKEFNTKVKAALIEVQAMDGKLKEDLYKVKDAVNQQVEGIKSKIKNLNRILRYGEDADGSEEHQEIKQIVEYLRDQLKAITGSVGLRETSTTGLEGIRNKMNQYVKKYSKDKFGDTAEGWIKDIWRNNVVVRYWLGEYLGYKTEPGELPLSEHGKDVISEEILQRIASQIKEQLDADVIKHIEVKPQGNVQTQLTAIHGGINRFVELLGRRVTKENSTFVTGIAKQLESEVASILKAHHAKEIRYLESAVQSTMVALSSSARQAWAEIHSFALLATNLGTSGTTTSVADDIVKVFDAASGFEEKVKHALKHPPRGRPPSTPSHAAAVDAAITGVTEELGKKLKPGVGSAVTLDKDETFQQYNAFVDQSEESLKSLTSEKLEDVKENAGTLPTKIKEIGTYAATGFSVEATRESLGKWSGNIKDELKNVLDSFAFYGTLIKGMLDKHIKAIGKGTENQNTLQHLQKKLLELNAGPVTTALKEANDIIEKADDVTTNTLRPLRNHVDKQVSEAQKALSTHARRQYVSSIDALLRAFAKKTESELKPLLIDVNSDLNIGLKGFMKKFDEKFVGSVEAIGAIDATSFTVQGLRKIYPMSQAAKILNDGFDEFFTKLQKQPDVVSDVDKYAPTQKALQILLGKLAKSQHFDHEFNTSLGALKDAIARFNPSKFGDTSTVITQFLKDGLSALLGEIGRAYVNTYEGSKAISWEETLAVKKTVEGENAARVFLTTLKILCDDLSELHKQCTEKAEWRGRQVYASAATNDNPLGDHFVKCGYQVASAKGGQDGELRCSPKMMGENILAKLNAIVTSVTETPHFLTCKPNGKQNIFSVIDVITCLFQHANEYFRVTHLPISSAGRYPSSIYDMLRWLCGLTYHPVYDDLSLNAFSDLFEKKEEPDAKVQGDGIPVKDEKEDMLEAHPANITALNLREMLTEVCHYSYDVLVSLLGHGHAGGIYACDFNTNPDRLSYPSNSSKCLDLLTEICLRLFHQLSFLYKQCTYPTQLGGWLDCHYGRDVGGSNWICNTMQCPNQNAGQTHNQTCDQKCNQTPKCGLKSPLQSFLEDGLPGFLPHPYGKSDCKMKCDAPNHFGKPCQTPMGFADLTNLASINGTGKRIKDALHQFCGKEISPLTKLCSDLVCLLQRPPQTLGDMFAFYYNFTNRWTVGSNKHREAAFDTAVNNANFGATYEELKIYYIFSGSHSAVWKGHSAGSLGSLVCSSKESIECGPYLCPVSHFIYGTFSSKHADKYLSWIVYQTTTFYDLLKKLYDECNSNCGPKGSNCLTTSCVKDCLRLRKPPTPKEHHSDCKSIVQCKKTLPTLSKYGFVFLQQAKLNGNEGLEKKRTCRNFCAAFKEVFNKESILVELIKKIDEFIFTIRQPFIWLNVALWSLSLFYLICVMVGRLDVLHIKSHLRIPSSHKITAQSLLAATQVGRLAKISYLQP
ncbi:hypothetical protein, conserved [Babesia bigemina]|uniref:Uncharacterized protein n=1 Tax=Babesia bigemina TaxID=5866 RepID=A0A061BSE4_BABBI|nr:hypothetical protein, conserved [Babesia bigemina]CDR71461.1 hypothetical protein, conserved [Babesia bigemina]|eukprot:XP_012770409.1 hypothetical protein, conserved [Babesia bigemina]